MFKFIVIGSMLIAGASYARFTYMMDPMPRARKPVEQTKEEASAYRYRGDYFQSVIDGDCKTLHIDCPAVSDLKQPFRFKKELKRPRFISRGSSFDTTSLKISLTVQNIWIGEKGRGVKTPHLLLSVTNKLSRPVIYQVLTETSKKCEAMGRLAHNAIALKPNETIQRVECVRKSGMRVKVMSVDTLATTRLGYHYVSRLNPHRLGVPNRLSENHSYEAMPPCKHIPWQQMEAGLGSGDIHWADIADFYSRHNCDEYVFFPSYRRATDAIESLPVKRPSATDLSESVSDS